MGKGYKKIDEHFVIGDINDFPPLSPEDDIFSGTSSKYVKSDIKNTYSTYNEFIHDVDSGFGFTSYDEW